jgi:hypothetical protein
LQEIWLLVDAVKNFFACGGQEVLCHSARWPWTCWLTRRCALRPTFGRYGCSSSSSARFRVLELVAVMPRGPRHAQRCAAFFVSVSFLFLMSALGDRAAAAQQQQEREQQQHGGTCRSRRPSILVLSRRVAVG